MVNIKPHHKNPFLPGKPVPSEQLKGRDNLIRHIVNKIFQGQSTIIVGPFRSGKTSILNYLSDSNQQNRLYGEEKSQQLIFYYVDINEVLDGKYKKHEFWQRVLKPLEDQITDNKVLTQVYQTCKNEKFSTYSLENLLKHKENNFQLVLMLDEFHVLLQYPTLSQGDFFASLRSLTSLNGQKLTLVITSNLLLSQLNEETKQYRSPTGSPSFNFMNEEVLETLSSSAIDELLKQGDKYFSGEDRQFLKQIAGGYPYFLQVAASVLWELYEDVPEKDAEKRRKQAQQIFYDKVEETLENIWQSWLPQTQNAFASLFNIQTSELNPNEIQGQLEELERYGFVEKTETGYWQVCSHIWQEFVPKKPSDLKKSEAEEKASKSEKADELLNNLWNPTFLLLMFIGVFVGNWIGISVTGKFSDPFFAHIIKFGFAGVGAFVGYWIAKGLAQISNFRSYH